MSRASAPISHADRFYIGGQWVTPSSDATISVIDSDTEQLYFTVPEAGAADIDRAVSAARDAFDNGPWPWLTHAQRAEHLRAIGAELAKRSADIGQVWPREAGVLHAIARHIGRRSGTVGHNAMRSDLGVSFGGFKQSGIGREGIHEGLTPFLEVKFMVLEGRPEGYEDTAL